MENNIINDKNKRRLNKKRYFFPEEWSELISLVTNQEHRAYFKSSLHTGGRSMEVLHLKPEDFDWKRETITFKVTKQRVAKSNSYSLGKTRTFFVSSKYLKEIKKFIRDDNIKKDEYLFLRSLKLPTNYDNLNNREKEKWFIKKESSYHQLFKRKLQKTKIEDWYNFSLHNIRKTYIAWMRLFVPIEELCFRTGHDIKTFMDYYGSSIIFTTSEKVRIMNIFGEVK